jgi:hypothetical protein
MRSHDYQLPDRPNLVRVKEMTYSRKSGLLHMGERRQNYRVTRTRRDSACPWLSTA